MVDGEVGQTVAKALRDLGGVGVRCAGKDGDELFATEPGDVVNLAEIVAEATRGVREDGIAAVVAMLVVDGLEAVEVEDDEGEVGASAARVFECVATDLFESSAVEQAGEGVGLGLGFELMLKLRHGEPDDAESGHDSDEDGREKREVADGGIAEVASRIVQVRIPGPDQADESVEAEEGGQATAGHKDTARTRAREQMHDEGILQGGDAADGDDAGQDVRVDVAGVQARRQRWE